MLEMLGLTKSRMVECDTLFFHELLLPICATQNSPELKEIHVCPSKATWKFAQICMPCRLDLEVHRVICSRCWWQTNGLAKDDFRIVSK
jgi:hypothetical protein